MPYPATLGDNLLDRYLHPGATVTCTPAAIPGQGLDKVTDNLRDLTHWSPSTFADPATQLFNYPTQAGGARTALAWIDLRADPGSPFDADTLIIDLRSVWPGDLVLLGSNDGTAWTVVREIWPISTSSGHLPTIDLAAHQTREGTIWARFAPVSYPFYRIAFGGGADAATATLPVITGIYLGLWYRFPTYARGSKAVDYRRQVKYGNNEVSRGGVRIKTNPVSTRLLTLNVRPYDADYPMWDQQVATPLERGQPIWFCLDDSAPETCAFLTLFDTKGDYEFDPQPNGVVRDATLELEQVCPAILW